jgi:flagellar biosynthesis protein FliP
VYADADLAATRRLRARLVAPLLGAVALGGLSIAVAPAAHAAPVAPVAPAVLTLAQVAPSPAASPASAVPAVTVLAAAATPDPSPSASSTTSGSGIPDVGIKIDSGSPALSRTVVVILLMTVASVAPAILLLMTSFVRFSVVLSLTRNALGLQGIPPNQVLVGLAIAMTLFTMGPIFSKVNNEAIQPAMKGQISATEALGKGFAPLREYMLDKADQKDLALFTDISKSSRPVDKEDLPATTLVPAFVISELRKAFLIGFIIFVPFLVIDLVVSSSLMGLGMVMLPPSVIALPLKLLLFVLIDGWGLLVRSVVASAAGGH